MVDVLVPIPFLPQILFLGPLMQLTMDCPCDLAAGLRVVMGESGTLGQWCR